MPQQIIRDELVALTSELIRIPSTRSRPEAVERCADLIANWLDRHALPYNRSSNNGIPIITALPNTEHCPLLLLSHFDVVDGNDEQFEPRIANGRLYGRGAIDDKYAVALSLILYRQACRAAQDAGSSLDSLPFGLLLTGDEETGGHDGAGHVSEWLKPEAFLALDGGQPGRIIIREKGIISLTLTAKGKAAHAARPWLGESGFDLLIDDYQRMKNLFDQDSPAHWHPTMVLSQCCSGSGATNVVPDRATATFDIRYTEKDDPNQLLAAIAELVKSQMDVRYIEPVFDGGESVAIKQLARISGANFSAEHGASDARFFSEKSIPGAVWGAEGEMSQHSDNEYLLIESMFEVYDILDELVKCFKV